MDNIEIIYGLKPIDQLVKLVSGLMFLVSQCESCLIIQRNITDGCSSVR